MVAVNNKRELRKIVDNSIDQNPTITTMKKDISELKQDVTVLKQDVTVLKEEQHRQGVIQEEIRDNVKAIAEAVSPLLKKSADMADFNQTLQDQGDQIKLTQVALKDHVSNKSIHVHNKL